MAMFAWLLLSRKAINAIIDEQGINSLDKFKLLDDKDVAKLCKVVRRPGGCIVNPRAGDTGQPAMIPAMGNSMSTVVEQNIKLAAWEV